MEKATVFLMGGNGGRKEHELDGSRLGLARFKQKIDNDRNLFFYSRMTRFIRSVQCAAHVESEVEKRPEQ